jgi:hypothetical protein
MDDEVFEAKLRNFQRGNRIACVFAERPDIDGTRYPTRTWVGEVRHPWDDERKHITVLWDRKQPGARGSRLMPLPEASLPDPAWQYIDVTNCSRTPPQREARMGMTEALPRTERSNQRQVSIEHTAEAQPAPRRTERMASIDRAVMEIHPAVGRTGQGPQRAASIERAASEPHLALRRMEQGPQRAVSANFDEEESADDTDDDDDDDDDDVDDEIIEHAEENIRPRRLRDAGGRRRANRGIEDSRSCAPTARPEEDAQHGERRNGVDDPPQPRARVEEAAEPRGRLCTDLDHQITDSTREELASIDNPVPRRVDASSAETVAALRRSGRDRDQTARRPSLGAGYEDMAEARHARNSTPGRANRQGRHREDRKESLNPPTDTSLHSFVVGHRPTNIDDPASTTERDHNQQGSRDDPSAPHGVENSTRAGSIHNPDQGPAGVARSSGSERDSSGQGIQQGDPHRVENGAPGVRMQVSSARRPTATGRGGRAGTTATRVQRPQIYRLPQDLPGTRPEEHAHATADGKRRSGVDLDEFARAPQQPAQPRWLRMLGKEAPKISELRLDGMRQSGAAIFKAKDVCGAIKLHKLMTLPMETTKLAALVEARKWIEPSPIYVAVGEAIKRMPETERRRIQHAHNTLQAQQHECLQKLKKFVEDDETGHEGAYAGCNVFTVVEHKAKQINDDSLCNAAAATAPKRVEIQTAIRPIVEPKINELLRQMGMSGTVSFETQEQVRQKISNALYIVQFDLVACFDQIQLHKEIRRFFRVAQDAIPEVLAVLPMGYLGSVQVAAAILNALCPPGCISIQRVDNILFCAQSREEAMRIAHDFERRCHEVGAQYTGGEVSGPGDEFEFCGERFRLKTVPSAQTPAAEESTRGISSKTQWKLQQSSMWLEKRSQQGFACPIKQLASFVGLCLFAGEQTRVWPGDFAKTMRSFAKLVSSQYPMNWNGEVFVEQEAHGEILRWMTSILSRGHVRTTDPKMSKEQRSTLFVDASAYGWGAVRVDGLGCAFYGAAWNKSERERFDVSQSCVAEPMALVKALCVGVSHANTQDISVCVYSDHAALVDVLNRAAGGLAHSAPYLWAATALRRMGFDFDGSLSCEQGGRAIPLEIRHIPGSANPADGISRGCYRPPLLSVTRIGCAMVPSRG